MDEVKRISSVSVSLSISLESAWLYIPEDSQGKGGVSDSQAN